MNKNNPKPSAGRRRLLAALGTGAITTALLPKRWTEPVLESVLLPAHAATSYGGQGSFTTFSRLTDAGSSLLDFLVPKANAGNIAPTSFDVCVRVTDYQGDIVVALDTGALYEGPSSGPIAIPFYNTVIPKTSGSGPSTVTISGEVQEQNGEFVMVGTVIAGSLTKDYTAPHIDSKCGIA
jgi:hypothetical protein